MRTSLRSIACGVSSVAFLGCGAVAREPASPQANAASAPTQQQQPGDAQPATGAPSPSPPPPPVASPVGPVPLFPGAEKKSEDGKLELRTREESLADFASSEKAIFLSAPDCATACRALRSMARAAGRACEPPLPASSEVDCKEIGARVVRAKTRVTEACGVCPDGPP